MVKPNKLWPMAHKSSLVLEGNTVKERIQAARQHYQTPVHIDWLRFTGLLRNMDAPSADLLFPKRVATSIWDERAIETARCLAELQTEEEFSAAAQAFELAEKVAAILGTGFTVSLDIKRGQDFYKYRRSIILNGEECGWVGYLTTGNGQKAEAQAKTLHVNLFGTACTFAQIGWLEKTADLVDEISARITRADLALDFFDGYQGGIEKVLHDYISGKCNVGGRKLKFNQVGDWANGHDRSLYVGTREGGKITNVYEKGHQLYGHEFGSNWLRFELRYGNQHRSFSSDLLRRPADFFAGASDWHNALLLEADAVFAAQNVPCHPRLAIETIDAEVSRAIRWFRRVAGPTAALAIKHMDERTLFDVCDIKQLPGRLKKFSLDDIAKRFAGASEKVKNLIAVESCPAFA